jgi:hypothetical protein
MGVPVPEMEPTENATAEALLSSLKTIAAAERRKHARLQLLAFDPWRPAVPPDPRSRPTRSLRCRPLERPAGNDRWWR